MAMLHLLMHDGCSGLRRPVLKILTNGLGLDDLSLALLAVVQLLVFIYSGTQNSSLFIIVINLIFFRFDALTELRAFMRTEFACISVNVL